LSSIHQSRLWIPLSALKEGVSRFTFRAVFPNLTVGDGCSFPGEIDVTAEVTSIGDEYLVKVSSESEGFFVCDRCSEDFKRPIKGISQALFTFTQAEGGDLSDYRVLSPSAEEIDITQEVIDALVLAVPTKRLCREKCLGLCSQCGANLNERSCSCVSEDTDPRWDALKGLRFDE